jgi:hypothetical protein
LLLDCSGDPAQAGISQVDMGAVLQQQLNDARVVVAGSKHHGAVESLIGVVRVGTPFQQQPGDLVVAVLCGSEEWREEAVVASMDVGAVGDELPGLLNVARFCGEDQAEPGPFRCVRLGRCNQTEGAAGATAGAIAIEGHDWLPPSRPPKFQRRTLEERPMGTSIAMAYPTTLFAKLADHTYVKCGTGRKAWGCWGSKTGGRKLRQGTGSTKRANAIAGADEKAGIKCYLINGVCHQAANRILLPAGITVRGARGYSISESLFGTYGRVGSWPCKSPFNQYPGVTGDLPECTEAKKVKLTPKAIELRALGERDKLDWHYIKGVLQIYGEATPLLKAESVKAQQATAFHLKLFMYMAEFHLGPMLDKTLAKRLKKVRGDTEKARLKIERPFAEAEANVEEFVAEFDRLTLDFQDEMANAMTPEQYFTLFDLRPTERVVLADPNIVSKAFRNK